MVCGVPTLLQFKTSWRFGFKLAQLVSGHRVGIWCIISIHSGDRQAPGDCEELDSLGKNDDLSREEIPLNLDQRVFKRL
jgi:hypothetical protein